MATNKRIQKKIHIEKICIAQNIFVNLNAYCRKRIIELFQCSLLYTKFCEEKTHTYLKSATTHPKNNITHTHSLFFKKKKTNWVRILL